MLTVPYKRFIFPRRDPLSEDGGALIFDLSAFISDSSVDLKIRVEAGRKGRICAALSDALLAKYGEEIRMAADPSTIEGVPWTSEHAALTMLPVGKVEHYHPGSLFHSSSYKLRLYTRIVFLENGWDLTRPSPYSAAIGAQLVRFADAVMDRFVPKRTKEAGYWQGVRSHDDAYWLSYGRTVRGLVERYDAWKPLRAFLHSEMHVLCQRPWRLDVLSFKELLSELTRGVGSEKRYVSLSKEAYEAALLAFEYDLVPTFTGRANWQRVAEKLHLIRPEQVRKWADEDAPALEALRAAIISLACPCSAAEQDKATHVIRWLYEEPSFLETLRRASLSTGRTTGHLMRLLLEGETKDGVLHSPDAYMRAWARFLTHDLFNKPRWDLCRTRFEEDIPDSDSVQVDLISSVDEFAEDLAASGAAIAAMAKSFSIHRMLPSTRYILRVRHHETGGTIGYLFMDDYFRTVHTWRTHEPLFKQNYNRIRYRVEVIRRQCRVLEQLDLDV